MQQGGLSANPGAGPTLSADRDTKGVGKGGNKRGRETGGRVGETQVSTSSITCHLGGPACGFVPVAWVPCQEPPEEAAHVTVPGSGPQHPPVDWGGGHSPSHTTAGHRHPQHTSSLQACPSRLSPPSSGTEEASLEWGVIPSTGQQPRPHLKHF